MKTFLTFPALLLSLLLLTACGGGGSLERDDSDDGGSSDTAYTVTLSLVDQSGETSTELSSDNPLTIQATVTQNGQAVSGQLVSFSLSIEGLATFGNDAGTALTNSQGVASIGLIVGENSGSALITASLDSGETATVGFTSSGTTAAVAQPTSLELFASQAQLASSGSDEIELQAIVKNAQNILLSGVTVSFSANANAAIAETQPVTDDNGIAVVLLRTGGDYENRTITVTASVSATTDLTQTLDIDVVGTEIDINGANSVIIDDTAALTINLEDSDNNGISGETITLIVEDENDNDVTATTLDDAAPTTSNAGRATVDFTATASGTYTIIASALSAITTYEISVQQDQFYFVDPPDVDDVNDDIPLNTPTTLTIQWLRESSPFSGGAVSFSASRGTITVADTTTNSNGQATFTIESDNAGTASISAVGTDGTGAQVSTQIEIAFIAEDAATIIVDATPDSIGPDGQSSTISAVVLDALGNRVRNKLVNFSVSDVSNGNLTDAQSRTDKRGIATTVYESNAVSTYQSVQITAYVNDTPTVTDTTAITVGDRPFDISLGTGNLIEAPQQSTYQKEFAVFVTDADANPVESASLTFSATPVSITDGNAYYKGEWEWNAEASIYVAVVTATCPNEDANGNGILDEGEDDNGDGELTPGNVASLDADATTDENGQALVYLNYPKQYGPWVQLSITARGESSGSESVESMNYILGVSTEDRQTNGAAPPSSPWGTGTSCFDTN